MNKNYLYGFLTATVLFLSLGNMFLYKAEAQSRGFGGVVPFVTPSGWVGLFNQNDGMMYFYDDRLQNCIKTVKVNTLGGALQE